MMDYSTEECLKKIRSLADMGSEVGDVMLDLWLSHYKDAIQREHKCIHEVAREWGGACKKHLISDCRTCGDEDANENK